MLTVRFASLRCYRSFRVWSARGGKAEAQFDEERASTTIEEMRERSSGRVHAWINQRACHRAWSSFKFYSPWNVDEGVGITCGQSCAQYRSVLSFKTRFNWRASLLARDEVYRVTFFIKRPFFARIFIIRCRQRVITVSLKLVSCDQLYRRATLTRNYEENLCHRSKFGFERRLEEESDDFTTL